VVAEPAPTPPGLRVQPRQRDRVPVGRRLLVRRGRLHRELDLLKLLAQWVSRCSTASRTSSSKRSAPDRCNGREGGHGASQATTTTPAIARATVTGGGGRHSRRVIGVGRDTDIPARR